MGIFDALTTAVSGLQGQSFALQNISGNIANSQTIGFKGTNSSFEDFVTGGNSPSQQTAGNMGVSSQSTNSVQGSITTSTIATYMAINGNGYFTVQRPTGTADGKPVFNGDLLYTRRGDFQPNQSGFLVNGAGYYLMGIPIDPTTDNPVGSQPQILQFSNAFLPAQATTTIDYQANLAANPLTTNTKTSVLGSELINPADFEANPVAGPPQPAKIIGTGAALAPDAAAVMTGTQDISGLPTGGVAGNLVINGTTIAVLATESAATIINHINTALSPGTLTASLNGSNQLVLTSANATTNVAIGGASTLALLNKLGLTVGTAQPTNLLTQSAVSAGQTMVIQVGANPALTVTFGGGGVQTLAQLNTALATLTGGTASVNATNGNINVTAGNLIDSIAVSGTASRVAFGIHNPAALPSNGTVIAADNSTFLNESLSGGSLTAFDATGAPVDVQLRWAKTNGVAEGGTDTWNLFYQVNSGATGTQVAWQNVGTNFTFAANGQLNPAITTLPITNLTVNGTSLGTVNLNFGNGGITQFADSGGNVNVNQITQNGSAAGNLQTLQVSTQGRIDGTFSNGRTIDLASIPLATFSGQNFLQKLDGSTFAATPESGTPLYNKAGTIVGSATEASNADIADEFSKLIVTQQAYSANTKIITTGNQMVQALLAMIQ